MAESLAWWEIVLKSALCLVLMVGAALCSGLNLGMLALDKVRLKALMTSGTEKEKRNVQKLLPLLEDRHMLIAVILLGNSMCTEMLPEIMDELLGQIVTLILCVSVIVIGCEVIPQALMVKDGLNICAKLHWFVWTLIYCTFVVTWPLARLLDCVLGKDHVDYFSRDELKEFMMLHGQKESNPKSHQPTLAKGHTNNDLFALYNGIQVPSVHSFQKLSKLTQPQSQYSSNMKLYEESIPTSQKKDERDDSKPVLTYDEVSIIQGIFAIHQKQVSAVMKPINEVFMLPFDTVLTRSMYEEIYQLGYSRIPIYFKDRSNIMGVLLTKQLIRYDPDETVPLSKMEISPKIPLIPGTSSLAQALKEFEKGTAHIAAVVSPVNFKIIGIVTMEDVLEQLLQEEIYDESDVRRAQKAASKSAGTPK